MLKHTIIALGGPDANAVTRDAVKHINSKLRFGDPEVNDIAIRDTTSEPPRFYAPSPADRDGTGTDYGLQRSRIYLFVALDIIIFEIVFLFDCVLNGLIMCPISLKYWFSS